MRAAPLGPVPATMSTFKSASSSVTSPLVDGAAPRDQSIGGGAPALRDAPRDLLAWGWLARRVNQRRLAGTMKLLGLVAVEDSAAAHDLSASERARLMQRLVVAMEAQDRYLEGHSRRVARHATMIARQLGLSSAHVA